MDEILTLLTDLSPFVILAYLVIISTQSRNKETDQKTEAARIAAEAAKVVAQAELEAVKERAQDAVAAREREATLARELAESRLQQAETNRQAAVIQSQTMVAVAALAGAQQQTTAAVVKSEKRIIASGSVGTDSLSVAIGEVLEGIVKLASGQVDQNIVIESLTTAVNNLVERLKETPGGAAVAEAIEDAVVKQVAPNMPDMEPTT